MTYRPFVFTIPPGVQPGDQALVAIFADALNDTPTLAFRPNRQAIWGPPSRPEVASLSGQTVKVGTPRDWADSGDEHVLRGAVERATNAFNTRALTSENVATLIEEHVSDLESHPRLAPYSLAALRRLAERIRETRLR